MGNLYMMTTIVDRKIVNKFNDLYEENNLNVRLWALGLGTASNDIAAKSFTCAHCKR